MRVLPVQQRPIIDPETLVRSLRAMALGPTCEWSNNWLPGVQFGESLEGLHAIEVRLFHNGKGTIGNASVPLTHLVEYRVGPSYSARGRWDLSDQFRNNDCI